MLSCLMRVETGAVAVGHNDTADTGRYGRVMREFHDARFFFYVNRECIEACWDDAVMTRMLVGFLLLLLLREPLLRGSLGDRRKKLRSCRAAGLPSLYFL